MHFDKFYENNRAEIERIEQLEEDCIYLTLYINHFKYNVYCTIGLLYLKQIALYYNGYEEIEREFKKFGYILNNYKLVKDKIKEMNNKYDNSYWKEKSNQYGDNNFIYYNFCGYFENYVNNKYEEKKIFTVKKDIDDWMEKNSIPTWESYNTTINETFERDFRKYNSWMLHLIK